MQTIQLFAKESGSSGFGTELDLSVGSPIKLTKSIQDIENPQTVKSDFSFTFEVPNTPVNSRFFKSAFNVNNFSFDPTKRIDAYINIEGQSFISGYIILEKISINENNNEIEYSLIFMGETSNFSAIVSPKDLVELNFTELSHSLNYTNVTNSWNNNLFSGDIVYPLAEYGYDYDSTTKQPINSTLALYNATSAIKGFTNISNGLELTQLRPFIKVRKVWDKIFQDAGFTYSSDFISNSPVFNSLYTTSSNESSSSVLFSTNPRLDTYMTMFSNTIWDANIDVQINFQFEIEDTSNSWDVNSGEYTTTASGPSGGYTYEFTINNLSARFTAPGGTGINRTFLIKALAYDPNGTLIYANGKTAYVDTGTNAPIVTPITRNVFSGVPQNDPNRNFIWSIPNLFPGSKVKFFVLLGSQILPNLQFQSGRLLGIGPDLINPSSILPNQIKQIDFIRGINDRFKLMWEPDSQNPKNFIITPWVDWIKNGNEKDWTSKLDKNSTISITPLFRTQTRELIFKDTEESDVFNFSYQQKTKESFGQLNQDSGIQVITGQREINSIFAPTPLAPIGNSDRFIIPHFAKDTESERQPIQIKPRLMFYNGRVTAPYTWYLKNDSGVSTAQSDYPIMSNFSTYPFDQDSLDINWNNSQQFWDVNVYTAAGNGRTGNTAYTTYWKDWFNFTYSPYSKIMEAQFILDIRDFINLRMNDKIFIKDSWWIPIEVKDYVLGVNPQVVKIKLYKLGDDLNVII